MIRSTLTRRTFLLAAGATAFGACSSRRKLSRPSGVANPPSPIDADPVGSDPESADVGVARPNPDADKVPSGVVVVGDSISVLSEDALDSVLTGMGFATVTINAESSRRIEVGGRKPTSGVDIVTFVAGAAPPPMWVIALGTNDAGLYGGDDEYQGLIDAVLDVIDAEVPLVWVNTYRGDHLGGCVQFNDLLRSTLDARGNATVADWYQQCIAAGSNILTDDGVHPNENGILVFAETVRAAIAARLA